jgi:hydroxymethylbilane synthase
MGAGKKLKIGTRGSPLALAQTRGFIESLKERHTSLECEIVTIQTSGDRVQDRFWSAAGGKGLFTKEIEEALLRNEIDLAVHSLKDLPAVIPDGLTIACLPKRLTYEDVLLTRDGSDLNGLPPGATVGTASLRRRVQLKRRRPDLNFALLRGNIDTRIKRLKAGEFDGIVLARAGMIRLGLNVPAVPVGMLPAPGQGCLCIEINIKNNELSKLLQSLHDIETELAVRAERRVMRGLEGNCNLPLGVLGEVEGPVLQLKAFLSSPDGGAWLEEEIRGPSRAPEALAEELLKIFFAKGARKILDSISDAQIQ